MSEETAEGGFAPPDAVSIVPPPPLEVGLIDSQVVSLDGERSVVSIDSSLFEEELSVSPPVSLDGERSVVTIDSSENEEAEENETPRQVTNRDTETDMDLVD